MAEIKTDNSDKKLLNALPKELAAKPLKKRNVLVFNWSDSFYHAQSIQAASKAFVLMGEKTGAYTSTVTSDPSIFTKSKLKKFDAIILNNAQPGFLGDATQAIARKIALIDFVKHGKGLIGIHALTAFGSAPNPSDSLEITFRDMIGGSLEQHPWNYDEFNPIVLRVENPSHPLNKSFGGVSKWILPFREEVFQFNPSVDREKIQVLLSLNIDETPDKGTHPTKDYPLAWIKNFGKGRVFYSALGHSKDSFEDKQMLEFLLTGMQYATGDLKVEVNPIPQESVDTEKGFVSIFDGKTLDGWRGDSKIWSVEDGCITGQTLPNDNITRNNFLIWENGAPKNFELKTKFKLVGGNSGIYFHSYERVPNAANNEPLVGVQADFAADQTWVGTIMEYTHREILAPRGRKVVIEVDGNQIISHHYMIIIPFIITIDL